VTFLFTDIEGSTSLWEASPESMHSALARHDAIVRGAIEAHSGFVFSTGGDGLAAAFSRAGDAVAAALHGQAGLAAEPWPDGALIRVRMGLHTGEVDERDGNYFGPSVNRAARLMAVGHGGQILCSAATAELLDGVELVDLGRHRLRDVASAQRVFQLGSQPFPGLRTVDAVPSNLPAETSTFVGRDRELAQIASLLDTARMVTLTGVGGVGKSRLALRAGAELLAAYLDGVWLVELAPLSDADALVEVVAATLGMPAAQGQPLAMALRDFLRRKQLLMLLDNCEHLLDPVAEFVEGVLAACPDVTVLATSREGLRVTGEQTLAVPSLGLPADDWPIEMVADTEAVRLFVQRAGETTPGFRLNADNVVAISRLVRRLDGIPLAIELAAARVRSLTPAELADRLDQRFRLLASGRRSAVERHQTLRRAIDWSYDLLTGTEQHTLNRAAVFAGDFTLTSAEAVITAPPIGELDVVDLLGRLVDKSLVVADDQGGATRYRLLETIRQYAAERLEAAGEAEAIRDRHAEHYATFAAGVGEGLCGRDEVSWTSRLYEELDNLRVALAWSVGAGNADRALRLLAPLAVTSTPAGYATCGWAASVVAIPDAATHSGYPQVLAFAGYAQANTGDLEATRTCRAALAAADALGMGGSALCRVLGCASLVAAFGGDFDELGRLAGRAAGIARSVGDEWALAGALVWTALAQFEAEEVDAATASADEALALAGHLNNPSALSRAMYVAGVVRSGSDPARALRFLDQSVEAAELVGNHIAIGAARGGQAAIRFELGEWQEAASLVASCLEHYRQVGYPLALGGAIIVAPVILEAIGDDESAATLVGKADAFIMSGFAGLTLLSGRPTTPSWRVAGLHVDWAHRSAGCRESLRHRMGADRFDPCAARGHAMDVDEIIAFAVERLTSPTA
jgi:predicted ATPase